MRFKITPGPGIRNWDALVGGTPMLDKLASSNILGIRVNDYVLELQEQCDGHFKEVVSPDDLRALAQELLSVAENHEEIIAAIRDLKEKP